MGLRAFSGRIARRARYNSSFLGGENPVGRELVILWAGRRQQPEWEFLCAPYRERIAHRVPIRESLVKVRSVEDGPPRRRAEAEALAAALPEPSWPVALDVRGKVRSSKQLAAWLEERLRDWPHPLVFLIGSDLGLDPEVRSKARESISLGPLTLAHSLARLVLYEQLYRALAIVEGSKYHRQPL
jgi:23S rRNA (pseudouridine1915-N3)-methyltransferase